MEECRAGEVELYDAIFVHHETIWMCQHLCRNSL